MDPNNTYYNDLIVKYFSGEANEQEMAELNLWLEESPENLKLFTDYRKSWEVLEQLSVYRKVDVNDEWKVFEKTIKGAEADSTITSPLQVEYRASRTKKLVVRFAAIAAIFLVLCVSGVIIYRYTATTETITLVATTGNSEGLLPDGSHVTLAPGSSLAYPETFKKEARIVKFQGEGFFEVSRHPDQPFFIEAGDNVRIEVLGTSFYVNTCNPDSLVEVILTTGKLAVYRKDQPDQKTILSPSEKVIISDKQPRVEKSVNTDVNYMAWKSGKLVFEETPLKEVVRLLNKVYRTDVILEQPEIGNCLITATFENQSADAVLHVIEETLSLTITRNGKQVKISGTGCTE